MNPNLQAGNYAAVMVIPGIGNLTKEHRLLQDMFQLLMSYGIEKRSAEIICENTVLTEMFSRGLTSVKDAKRALTEVARNHHMRLDDLSFLPIVTVTPTKEEVR